MVVSHSRALAEAAVALSREMLQGRDLAVEVAAGVDHGALGTDATAILAALEAADRGDGVVVLMDLGSAVLSAELALEMLDDEARARVVLCPAPIVEGLVVACVAAAGGASREVVADEALQALTGKQSHLGGGPDGTNVAPPDPGPAHPDGADTATASVVVPNPHGLHARPAARLVQEALATGVAVELRNATTGSEWVPAGSLSRVATLGAVQGHRLELRAAGPGAQEALTALVALAGRSFDEPAAPAGGPGSAAPPAGRPGPPAGPQGPVAASPGVAIGPARVLQTALRELDLPEEPLGPPGQEWARLTAARDTARHDVRRTRAAAAGQVGEAEAALFDAHLLLLDDPDLLADARRGIDAGSAAPVAWRAAVQRVQAAFAAVPDPYLQARAADVAAVGDAVLRLLLGSEPGGSAEQGPSAGPAPAAGVLLARDLTPAQAVALDPAVTVGVVLAEGSPTSHSAILVRARGIPAVVGVGAAVLDTAEGTVVALDGGTGELVLDPSEAVLDRLRARERARAERARTAADLSFSPARTRDGVEVLVGANLGSVQDARTAAGHGADLAGLVRTEFLFLDRSSAPDVEEQQAVYGELAAALGGRRLTLRTLDVGGDKPLPYLPVPPEANPFLGLRGLRLSLAMPGLLADQLLAVVRVAQETPVSLMFPMVTTVAELQAARQELDAAVARAGGGRPAGLQVGMMVEVPAAALKAAAFRPYVDFLSIGTNDLTQYAMAAERGNPAVSALGDPFDPGVLRLVAAVCAGAGDRLVAVCGEMAADGPAARLLVGLGVRELSVSPRAVPEVKQAVRALDLPAAAATATAALLASGPGDVRALLAEADAGTAPAAG